MEKKPWEELEDSRFGMLAVGRDPAGHFIPMTAFAEPESGKIWFYTNRDSHLAQATESGAPGVFIVMAKNQEVQACMRGELRATCDALHLDKYWSAAVSAWFPKGKDDPSLTMMCLTRAEADVWVSDAGVLRFGWETAKANLTRSTPDVGGHAHLEFP